MGRIRQKWIKDIAKHLVSVYPEKFSADFVMNKKVLDEFKVIQDKYIRNEIAGYIVRVVEKKKT
jgi:small subunit ribosomal protein S17e